MLPGFQDIAGAPNGMDQFERERVVHLAAQPAHIDVHHIGVAVEVHVPDCFGDQGSRQHLARRAAPAAIKEGTPWKSDPAAGRRAWHAGAISRFRGRPDEASLARAKARGAAAIARAPAIRKRRTVLPDSRPRPVRTLVPARVRHRERSEKAPAPAGLPGAGE
jgi:hypothetical protein